MLTFNLNKDKYTGSLLVSFLLQYWGILPLSYVFPSLFQKFETGSPKVAEADLICDPFLPQPPKDLGL